jgi:uncharacterized protein YdhG (YjbR/CyaY superfamily)
MTKQHLGWATASSTVGEVSKMRSGTSVPKTIDEYIAGFPHEVQDILEEVRKTIRAAAPEAEEAIKYRMPTFTLNGNLVHFAAFKNHIGVYPTPTATEEFRKELSLYKGGRGSVQFSLDRPIPYGLISRMVKFRVRQNLERVAVRKRRG